MTGATRRKLVIAAATVFIAAGPAHVSARAPSLTGKYAASKSACAARDYFATLKDTAFDLPVFSCTGVRFDQAGGGGETETFRATATKCVGEGDVTGKPRSFQLLRKAGTIQFLWSDGTRSGVLVRC